MYNQRNYRPFGQRLPAPTPQAGLPPFRPMGTLNSNQSYLRPPPPPPPPPLQNPNWSQNQHPPRIAPPYPHFYRLPPPPLAPLPTSSYFSPAPFGTFLPPPPSSPPRPPPLPPASPPTNSNVNQSQTTVKITSEFNILSPPPPRDEKTVKKIQVLCQYIAKHGDKFEHMTCQKEIGNPEFEFLFGGVPGSQAAISHEYFKWMKKKYISNELPEQEHNRDVSHSPAGSDMDMEDDITHPEEPGKSFVSANHKPDYISNEVDIKPKEGQILAPDDNQFEKPTTTVGVVDSERSVDSKTEQCNIDLHQQMNQKKESPFRLVQGYPSDDSSENDNETHFENVSPVNEPFFENLSPVAVSPEVKNGSTLSEPVVEASLNITSNIPEPSTNTKNLDNKNDGGTSIEGNDTVCRKNGGVRKENSNAKLQVDEFGRMVKKGGDESDSDDYNRRRSKRGRRSRSRSRSPYERRRRSPRRRRENRSRSRSWSPKKRPRSRSRSPYNRRNRSQLQEICHDFRLGRCFRETCRYSHDPEKIEESWRRRNKQQYLEPVSDRFQNSDKLVPEKYEADNHVNRNDSVDKEFVESPGHTSDVASEQPATGTAISGSEPQLAGEYNLPLLPSSSWNSLPPPPPPPRPQFSGPIPHYQQNQPSFQNNYSFQPFVTPYGPQMTSNLGVYPVNYPIIQQPAGPTSLGQDNIAQIASSLNLVSSNFRPVRPTSFSQDNFAQISSSPNLVASNAREPPSGITQSFLQNLVADNTAEFPLSRISSHYNPYASTFDKPLSNTFGPSPDQKDTSGGDQYDPLFDSIDPSSVKKSDNGTKEVAVTVTASEENDEFGETADAEVGAVENDSHSPSSPIDLRDVGTREIEIDQVKPKKSKDSRSMKLFKVSVADFVKEVLKPSWRQGNMSKEAFKTIVKKTVDKVSGAMKKHQVPKSQAKINHYIDSSQRKLTKLVMGYVDKYVKV